MFGSEPITWVCGQIAAPVVPVRRGRGWLELVLQVVKREDSTGSAPKRLFAREHENMRFKIRPRSGHAPKRVRVVHPDPERTRGASLPRPRETKRHIRRPTLAKFDCFRVDDGAGFCEGDGFSSSNLWKTLKQSGWC